ncbi:LPS export ABC transporter periplasmic protein LptC [Candidatus Methylocalor cossyra]|uniref:Lipopolysaccharide export system protein LptC n=1 Tax=Candidatus Methylocalor cossyra TaxID=3108543 RepID=A0ABM9NG37_9GAMM
MSQIKSFLSYLVLGLLALGTWWAAEYLTPRDELPAKQVRGRVDYYSKKIRRWVMDETGRPKELLLADTLTHYENDDHSELEKPVMTLYSKQGPPWVIHADSALVPGKGDQIFLYGNVLVLRDADKNGRTMRIETTNARVQPDAKYAETDEFVRVLSPPDTLTGTGGQVWFGDDLKVTIFSQVRRKHEVPQQ